jgi:hypothetical protein
MSQVTRPPSGRRSHGNGLADRAPPKVILSGQTGQQGRPPNTGDLVSDVEEALAGLETSEAVYAFWEANLPNFAAALERDPGNGRSAIQAITAKLKARLRALGGTASSAEPASRERPTGAVSAAQNGKSSEEPTTVEPSPPVSRAKERRVRDRDHLAFVARHPCLICGRRPAQAHHVRFAQPRAMAMKVSDEFTVPLCAGHHDAVHRTGDERAWWAARDIDALAVALRLWTASDKSVEFPSLSPPAHLPVAADAGAPARTGSRSRPAQDPSAPDGS